MKDLFLTKKYLKRKLVFLTPIITVLLHFYWTNRNNKKLKHEWVDTKSFFPTYTIWKPMPQKSFSKPPRISHKCTEVLLNTSDFRSFIDYHRGRERKIWLPEITGAEEIDIKERELLFEKNFDSIIYNISNGCSSFVSNIRNFIKVAHTILSYSNGIKRFFRGIKMCGNVIEAGKSIAKNIGYCAHRSVYWTANKIKDGFIKSKSILSSTANSINSFFTWYREVNEDGLREELLNFKNVDEKVKVKILDVYNVLQSFQKEGIIVRRVNVLPEKPSSFAKIKDSVKNASNFVKNKICNIWRSKQIVNNKIDNEKNEDEKWSFYGVMCEVYTKCTNFISFSIKKLSFFSFFNKSDTENDVTAKASDDNNNKNMIDSNSATSGEYYDAESCFST